MLDNHKVPFIFIRDTKIFQKSIRRLSHHHGREKLTPKPCAASRRYRRLNDSDFQIWALFAKHVGGTQATGSSSDNGDVGLGIGVKIREIAAGHGARNLGFADRSEGEIGLPIVSHGFQSFVLDAVAIGLNREIFLQVEVIEGDYGLGEGCGWWRHVSKL